MRVRRAAQVFAFLASSALAATAQNQTWIHQFGSNLADKPAGATADGVGGAYVCGRTYGNVGAPNAGDLDVWLARYDSAGGRTWIRQFGTSVAEDALAVAPDASNGVYVVGQTLGSLGGPTAGMHDAWLARYDGTGAQLWIRQLGTTGDEYANGAASDGSGGVYVVGWTSRDLAAPNVGSYGTDDGWVARYDESGNQTWIRQLAVSWEEDAFLAAAPDGAGGVFAGGYTSGNAWLVRVDGAGNTTWSQTAWSTSSNSFDAVFAATPDGSGGVYVAGYTNGNLGGPSVGPPVAWVARYDSAGAQVWVHQLGSSAGGWATSAALDPSGGVYVGGKTDVPYSGSILGYEYGWIARFDNAGTQSWMSPIGTSGYSQVYAIASAGTSGAIVAGRTDGSLGGANAGIYDVWVAGYDVPCGATFNYCTAGTTSNGCVPTISGSGTASASASSGFTISVANIEGQKQGLIFYGADNTGFAPAPWGASFLCIKSPLQRSLAQNSGGTISQCDGALALDWNAFRAANPSAVGAPFAAGQRIYAQGWFRDPPSAKTTNLTGALQFNLCP